MEFVRAPKNNQKRCRYNVVLNEERSSHDKEVWDKKIHWQRKDQNKKIKYKKVTEDEFNEKGNTRVKKTIEDNAGVDLIVIFLPSQILCMSIIWCDNIVMSL